MLCNDYYVSLINRYTCNPFGFVVDRESVSTVIRSHTAIVVVVRAGGVAAVSVDVSVESIESLLVVIIVVPFLFTSHTEAPVVQAVSTYAPIHTIVQANKLLYVISPVFVPTALSAVHAIGSICTYRTFLFDATN